MQKVSSRFFKMLAVTLALVLCFSFSSVTAFAAAGGYNSRTISANNYSNFTLTPSGYSGMTKLTCEVKSIDSGITSCWMEVTSNDDGRCIWSGFINAVPNQKSETWFAMHNGETYHVYAIATGSSGKVTVAASLWSLW